jgi:hypothetical protein
MPHRQKWWPDTHPGYEFHTEDGVCFAAYLNGAELEGPQVVYNQVLVENQTKNRALAALSDTLPHLAPEWDFGVLDGVVTFTLPGASDNDRLIAAAALAPFGQAVVLA